MNGISPSSEYFPYVGYVRVIDLPKESKMVLKKKKKRKEKCATLWYLNESRVIFVWNETTLEELGGICLNEAQEISFTGTT